jgi:hypothetical protein
MRLLLHLQISSLIYQLSLYLPVRALPVFKFMAVQTAMGPSAVERLVVIVLTSYTVTPPGSKALLLSQLLPSDFITSLRITLIYTMLMLLNG